MKIVLKLLFRSIYFTEINDIIMGEKSLLNVDLLVVRDLWGIGTNHPTFLLLRHLLSSKNICPSKNKSYKNRFLQ